MCFSESQPQHHSEEHRKVDQRERQELSKHHVPSLCSLTLTYALLNRPALSERKNAFIPFSVRFIICYTIENSVAVYPERGDTKSQQSMVFIPEQWTWYPSLSNANYSYNPVTIIPEYLATQTLNLKMIQQYDNPCIKL